MIHVTPEGHKKIISTITGSIAKNLHLFTANGELTGHGYAAKNMEAALWDNGSYPKIVWEFAAGDPVDVLGWFITDDSNQMIFSEEFDTPYEIKNTGDRIGVNIRLVLLAGD